MNRPDEEHQAGLTEKYYYFCLYNMLVLFAAPPSYLGTLAGPGFDVPFEMETEFLCAFDEPVFSAIFESGKVAETLRSELLQFKQEVAALPNALWKWEEIMAHANWQPVRARAEQLLQKLGEERREYEAGFTTILEA